MKNLFIFFTLVYLLVFFSKPVFAESNYVLPYPSFMPGNILYKINLIKDDILRYWYFGNFNKFKYNLRQADKYLVEAKTLFEYKQYFLGFEALKKSDKFFSLIATNLKEAEKEKKNIRNNIYILKSAAAKHTEVLEKLRDELPKTFNWQAEKEKPIMLNLKATIDESISIRSKDL